MSRPTVLISFLVMTTGIIAQPTLTIAQVTLNEIRIDQPSIDMDEYFELKGTPGTSLNGMTYIVLGFDSVTGSGTIECIIPLTGFFIQEDSLFAMGDSTDGFTPSFDYDHILPPDNALNFENRESVSHLVVTDFIGVLDDDLDINDDGTLDSMPWNSIIDCVGILDDDPFQYTYCATGIGPNGTYPPAHAYRCPETGVWLIGSYADLQNDTPGDPNISCVDPPPSFVDIDRSPCVPFVTQPVTISAITLGATTADICWKLDGGILNTVAMSISSTFQDTTTFSGVIPGQAINGGLVEYVLKAIDGPDTTVSFERGYFVGTVPISTIRINDANGRNIYDGYGAKVSGIVTAAYGTYGTTNTDYYVQDGTGGINLFKFGSHPVQPGLGDDITASGTIDQFLGHLELSEGGDCASLNVEINGPGPTPSPLPIRTCDVDESTEGMLIQVEYANVIFATVGDTLLPNQSLFVSNCYPGLDMFVDAGTDIPGTIISSPAVTVVGICGQFDSSFPLDWGYEVRPRSLADISFQPVTGTGKGHLPIVTRLLQNTPNPFNHRTSIPFEIPRTSSLDGRIQVRIKIFDIQGRLVATVLDSRMEPGRYSAPLNRADLGNAGAGVYFYRLEVADQVLARKFILTP